MTLLNDCKLETHAGTHNIGTDIWSILAPYSAAAQTEQGLSFYKRTYREPLAVHQQLQRVTNNLISQMNQRLPKMISIADPYANPQTVSERHCHDFSLPYLIRLLRGLNPLRGGLIHLCPYISTLLEKYHFVQIETKSFASKPYTDVLDEHFQTGKLILTGKQCIHTERVNKIFLLHLSDCFSSEKMRDVLNPIQSNQLTFAMTR
jgi:hypothetical protein